MSEENGDEHGRALSMRIVIFTVGTEGDARPYVALGKGLAAVGHDVAIATSQEFESFVRAHGLNFKPLTADFVEMMRRNKSVLDRRNQIAMLRTLIAETRRMAKAWAVEGIEAACSADLIVGSGNVSLLGASVAEKLGVAFVRSQLQPFDPSRALPPVLFRSIPLPGWANLTLTWFVRIAAWRLMRQAVDGVRRELALPNYPWAGPWTLAHAAGGRILYGFSRHLVPRQPEWPERIAMPGFFVLKQDDSYVAPPALEWFLSRGSKPIYVGFGSMVTSRSEHLAKIVLDAVRLSGRRAVIGSGWADLARNVASSDDVFVIDRAPHDWLFRRVALAVHHCGAGTVAACARAGIPTVPVPFVGDQFFWGWQLGRMRVATRRLNHRTVTARRLARAIGEAGQTCMVRRAAALGELMRTEDGVQAAVDQLGKWGVLRRPDAPTPAARVPGA